MTLLLLHLLIANNESLVLVINSDVIDNDESYLFRDNNGCLFRDVESVQEFSDIQSFFYRCNGSTAAAGLTAASILVGVLSHFRVIRRMRILCRLKCEFRSD